MKVIRQGVPALLLSLAILSGSVCLASEAEVQTVRATLWDAWPITVDETPICTVNEYDRFQYPLAYNGSVYIPLQTVSDWLGARFDWDETANTVTLTKTGDPYYRHYTLDQPAPWTAPASWPAPPPRSGRARCSTAGRSTTFMRPPTAAT